jgi:hypothetical protein
MQKYVYEYPIMFSNGSGETTGVTKVVFGIKRATFSVNITGKSESTTANNKKSVPKFSFKLLGISI